MKLVKDLRGHMHVKDAEGKKKIKKKLAAMLSMAMIMSMMVCNLAFAGEATTTDLTDIVTAVTSKLSVAEVAAIIALIIGSGIGFVLIWFGARKLVNSIVIAFKTGKLHF